MRKLVTILLAGGALLMSSCEYQSVGVSYSTSTYARPVYARPVYTTPVYSTRSYRYHTYHSPPPDWMRYGGNWVPARRHCRY